MSIFNNRTGKFLSGAFDRGITSIKDFFDIDQNAKREEAHKLDRIQDAEDFVYEEKEKEEATSFFSKFLGGASSDNSDRDSREASSSYWDRDPGQARREENDRQERDNREREDYERQSKNDEER